MPRKRKLRRELKHLRLKRKLLQQNKDIMFYLDHSIVNQ
jgi:hypothetical protein